MDGALKPFRLTHAEFRRVRDLLYEACRIDLVESKAELIQARLSKRLRALGFNRFRDYLQYVERDPTGQELSSMVDLLTTNLTFFFREPDHFARLKLFLADLVASGSSRFRAWSAGCSSGEEAYSMAMIADQVVRGIPGFDALILATDVSARMVEAARAGVFNRERLRGIPPYLWPTYFVRQEDENGPLYRIRPEMAAMVRFRRHNLNGRWPMKGLFDAVFCRNVMIYFDKSTQKDLVERFTGVLRPGGLLVLGHSEGLLGARCGLVYVSPGVYRKTIAERQGR